MGIFNRENLITWNELAPSMQEVIKALQTEITTFNEKELVTSIIKKLLHFDFLFKKHVNSDHPHPNSLNCMLRQPNTFYKIGDMVFDMEAPPYCYLECIDSGYSGDSSIEYDEDAFNGYISDEDYDYYSNIANVNEALQRLYNNLQKHLMMQNAHPKATNFLIRQPNTTYGVGARVFDPDVPPYCYLECIQSGVTASIPEPTLPTITDPTTLRELDSTLQTLVTQLENHINSTNPHEKYNFLIRNTLKTYELGNTVFYNARYQLECAKKGIPNSLPDETINADTSTYQTQYNQDILDAIQAWLPNISSSDISLVDVPVDAVLQVYVIDLRNSEAILIQTEEQTILIDTGADTSSPSDPEYQDAVLAGKTADVYYIQQKLLIQALEKMHVTRIDKLILTHPHGDHIQNAYCLIDPSLNGAIDKYPYLNYVSVEKVYDNGVTSNTPAYIQYHTAMQNKGTEYQVLKAGDILEFGQDITFEVLWPTPAFRDSVNTLITASSDESNMSPLGHKINDTSIVGILRCNDVSMMLAGDIEAVAENQILELYKNSSLHCDILKVPNHGYWTSSTDEFISAVAPTSIIISDGTILKERRYDELKSGQLETIIRYHNHGIDYSNMFFTRFNYDISITVSSLGNYFILPSYNEEWIQLVPRPIRIHMLNIGSGDAILVKTPEQTILFDTGEPFFANVKRLLQGLEHFNVHKIDKLIITHFHRDHHGGAAVLLSGNANFTHNYTDEQKAEINQYVSTITVDEVYDNGIPPDQWYVDEDGKFHNTESVYYRKYRSALGGKKATHLKAGDILEFGEDVTFEVLWPTEEYANLMKLKPTDLLLIENNPITSAYKNRHPVDPVVADTSKSAYDFYLNAVKGLKTSPKLYIPPADKDEKIIDPLEVEGATSYTIWDPFNTNNTSIVGILRYKGFTMLFTGDCETESQLRILGYLPDPSILHTDVLKAGHHGALSGSYKKWIEAIRPSCVLVSKDVKYDSDGMIIKKNKAPDSRSIKHWTNNGAPAENIYWTAFNGHITITVDDWSYNVTCQTERDWVDFWLS